MNGDLNIRLMTHFFICFLSQNCLGALFLHLKSVKFNFHLGHSFVHCGLENT